MAGLVDMGKQFGSLPMDSLIGAPLQAAAKANAQMISANADFILRTGFMQDPANPTDPNAKIANMVTFSYKQNIAEQVPDPADATKTITKLTPKDVTIDVPMLAILPLPSLKVDKVDIAFTMSVNSSTEDSEASDSEAGFEGSASVGWGPFKATVKVHGKTSSHSSHTRKSDNSAKYDVAVSASDGGMPEGLARVLDMMHDAITPSPSTT